MSLMGIDIGTTGCRSIIFNEEGKILSQAYKEYPEIYPNPGWVEMDPNVIWDAIKHVIKKSVSENSQNNDEVQALCASVLGVAVTPINKKGEPLYNSLTAVDGRCSEQSEILEEKLGKELIYEKTGQVNSPAWSISKLMWIKDNEPEVFKNTWKFVLYEDFLMVKLGLEPTISHSLAGLTMAFNPKDRKWSKTALEAAEIDEDLLSKAIPSGEIVGEIGDSIAEELGLPKKTRVVTGGFDQAMSALGGGLVKKGDSTLCFGTIECVTTSFSEFDPNPVLLKNNHPIFCHAIKDQYITIGWCFTSGALLKWYRDNMALDEKTRAGELSKDVYDIIMNEASKEPSKLFVLPHFMGSGTPYLDSRSQGAIVGLDLSTSRQDIVKGIMDSLSYETKLNIENIEMAGVKIGALNFFGGGAKSDILSQNKADIYEKEINALSISETGALGAMLLAGSAIGKYKDIDEAVKVLIRPRKTFYPEPKFAKQYRKNYELYKELYPTLKKFNHRISGL